MLNRNTVLGLLVAVITVGFSFAAFAADGTPRPDLNENVKQFLAIAAGLGMGLAAFGGALGQGRAIAAAMEGIARNPGADKKIFTPMIIGLVFIEVMVILTFVITNGLASKI